MYFIKFLQIKANITWTTKMVIDIFVENLLYFNTSYMFKPRDIIANTKYTFDGGHDESLNIILHVYNYAALVVETGVVGMRVA